MTTLIRSLRLAVVAATASVALTTFAHADASGLPPDSFCAECGLFADPAPGEEIRSTYTPLTGYAAEATAKAEARPQPAPATGREVAASAPEAPARE